MDTILIKIEDIKPYKNNPKTHTQEQIKKVSNSIKKFGFIQPLVIDNNNEIIIGHCRFESAKLLGLKEVPVIKLDTLTEKEITALRLTDNKLNESPWDMDLVIEELKLLDLKDEEIDIKDLTEPIDLVDISGFDADLCSQGVEDIGWNPPKTEEAFLGDGINELVGYGLQSFWKDIRKKETDSR